LSIAGIISHYDRDIEPEWKRMAFIKYGVNAGIKYGNISLRPMEDNYD